MSKHRTISAPDAFDALERPADPELSALMVALFMEETTDVLLTDQQIREIQRGRPIEKLALDEMGDAD